MKNHVNPIEPLVSVKMVTYNHAPFIGQAIEGVLMQDIDFPFELVIAEDCSTDGTREIVFDYQKKHPDTIRVISSDENVGERENSWRATKACRGKYIAYCDGDDYWHNNLKLQKQIDYLEKHPECGLVHSDYNRHFVSTDEILTDFNRNNKNIPDCNLSIGEILRGSQFLYILTVTVVARKKLIDKIVTSDYHIYRDKHFLIGDTPLWAEIAYYSGTKYFNESLATYRVMEESASKFTCPLKQLEFGLNIQELFLYLVAKYGLSPASRRYHEIKWGQHALLLAFHSNDRQLANSAKYYLGPLTLKQRIYYTATTNTVINKFSKYLYRCLNKKFNSNKIESFLMQHSRLTGQYD